MTIQGITGELPRITKRIICISGFTQPRHGQTGLSRVWMALRAQHTSAICDVTLHPWNENWPAFVRHLLATGPALPHQLDIRIIGYSWGVGHGAMTLCQLLRSEGVTVRRLVSCDGVYRSGWALWRSIWSPLLGTPVIQIPANVERVDMIRQQRTIPRGHRLVPEQPLQTEIEDHGILQGYGHVDIDNSEKLLQMAQEAAA